MVTETTLMNPEESYVLLVWAGEQVTPKDAEKVAEELKKELPNAKVFVFPSGYEVKVLYTNGVYHRERCNDYEYEIFAKSEEDLKKRLDALNITTSEPDTNEVSAED